MNDTIKTRKIRILVLIDPNGNYNAAGYNTKDGHASKEDLSFIWDGMDTKFPDAQIKTYWVEAEVPIPNLDIPVIEGFTN